MAMGRQRSRWPNDPENSLKPFPTKSRSSSSSQARMALCGSIRMIRGSTRGAVQLIEQQPTTHR